MQSFRSTDFEKFCAHVFPSKEKPSALKKLRPLLRRAVKVCRLESWECVPPLCGNKNVITALRRAKHVCRLESWEYVPPDRRSDSLLGIGTA